LIPVRKRTARQKVGEVFSVLIGLVVFALLGWIGLRIVWFLI
jgi:hypothetical protein